jgi:hypothetical protein
MSMRRRSKGKLDVGSGSRGGGVGSDELGGIPPA